MRIERAFEIVSPAVVGTAEIFCFSLGFRHYGCGVMTADVEEAAQNIVVASDDENWLAGDFTCDVLPDRPLIGATDELPRVRKDRFCSSSRIRGSVYQDDGGVDASLK